MESKYSSTLSSISLCKNNLIPIGHSIGKFLNNVRPELSIHHGASSNQIEQQSDAGFNINNSCNIGRVSENPSEAIQPINVFTPHGRDIHQLPETFLSSDQRARLSGYISPVSGAAYTAEIQGRKNIGSAVVGSCNSLNGNASVDKRDASPSEFTPVMSFEE